MCALNQCSLPKPSLTVFALISLSDRNSFGEFREVSRSTMNLRGLYGKQGRIESKCRKKGLNADFEARDDRVSKTYNPAYLL